MKEKKARVEDALHATRAAVEEGIVPGGGVALIRAGKALDGAQARRRRGGRRRASSAGRSKSRCAGSRPTRARKARSSSRRSRTRKGDDGYNAGTDEYEDLVEAGVIDPTKVVRTALQNAASIASLLLTTEALVAEIPEEKKERPAAAAARRRRHGRDVLRLRAKGLRLRKDLRLQATGFRATGAGWTSRPASLFSCTRQCHALRRIPSATSSQATVRHAKPKKTDTRGSRRRRCASASAADAPRSPQR